MNLSSSPCLAASVPVTSPAIFPWLPVHHSTHNLHIDNEENSQQNQILACSPISSNTGLAIKSKEWKFLRAIRKQIHQIIQMLRDAFLVAIRAAEIGTILSPLLILGPVTYALVSLENLVKQAQGQHGHLSQYMEHITWSYILQAVQWLGPAFIKLTQWAATRRDLFPLDLCEKLSTLHTANCIHSWRHTDQLLREAFGNDYAEQLKINPKDILGSGCVAQVYKGELLLENSGERKPVAVKVLHPRIALMVERDLMFIKRIASLVDSLPIDMVKCLSLPRAVDNFEGIIRRQVDLRIEARNLRRFHANFSEEGGRSSTGVAFPKPVPGWESQSVLVEDLIAGDAFESTVDVSAVRKLTTRTKVFPISAFLADSSEQGLEKRKKLARPLLDAFLKVGRHT